MLKNSVYKLSWGMDETRQENLDISIHRAKCSITLKDVMVQRTAMPQCRTPLGGHHGPEPGTEAGSPFKGKYFMMLPGKPLHTSRGGGKARRGGDACVALAGGEMRSRGRCKRPTRTKALPRRYYRKSTRESTRGVRS